MALSDKELMQICGAVDKVIESRLMEFSEIQLSIVSDMLLSMTDKYVKSLMQLAQMMGLPDQVARNEAIRREADRMSKLMLQGLKK